MLNFFPIMLTLWFMLSNPYHVQYYVTHVGLYYIAVEQKSKMSYDNLKESYISRLSASRFIPTDSPAIIANITLHGIFTEYSTQSAIRT